MVTKVPYGAEALIARDIAQLEELIRHYQPAKEVKYVDTFGNGEDYEIYQELRSACKDLDSTVIHLSSALRMIKRNR